ncbi:MAG: uncharacterized protein PWQ22_1360 [Archaeoglobaceae archaeon]|nr:uncharacterized protein [Archaeoglobaceae archaeon]MDK2876950.1 uncharacterized protein [Archaeoglobaceae archaeon]
MEIIPIAYDSMGVRSMATFVKTKDLALTIDPSVSLAPSRYGLPPHRLEIERMNEKWKEIRDFVSKSDAIAITHYHYDHHNPNEVEILKGKRLFLKHFKEKINRSQSERANYFLERLREINAEFEFSDGKSYEFGNTIIEFSKPVFHGVNQKLGFVLEIFISEGNESFLFSSDVEGPIHEDQTAFIIEREPRIVFIDGPMTYMLGYRFSGDSFNKAVENIKKILEVSETVALDHHLLRDLKWREKISGLFSYAEELGVKLCSTSEFLGKPEDLLEAKRKELYQKYR